MIASKALRRFQNVDFALSVVKEAFCKLGCLEEAEVLTINKIKLAAKVLESQVAPTKSFDEYLNSIGNGVCKFQRTEMELKDNRKSTRQVEFLLWLQKEKQSELSEECLNAMKYARNIEWFLRERYINSYNVSESPFSDNFDVEISIEWLESNVDVEEKKTRKKALQSLFTFFKVDFERIKHR